MNNLEISSAQSEMSFSDLEGYVNAAYRQVFGNAHIFEEDRSITAESLFINGDLTVQGFVCALALSDAYRRKFLDNNGPYRFVELNFKHLLGRAPRTQKEVSEHVQILNNEGYDAEINSYLYSAEYMEAFGFDTVPYNRGSKSLVGESVATYNRSQAMTTGTAVFDGSQKSKLLTSLATGSSPASGPKTPGPGGRDSKRYVIRWSTASPVGINRRVSQVTTVPFSSLTTAIQSVHRRGGKIATIAST